MVENNVRAGQGGRFPCVQLFLILFVVCVCLLDSGLYRSQLLASDAEALAEIFGETNLDQVSGFLKRVNQAPPEQRFDLLRRHVLPDAEHDVVRIDVDFAPNCLAPAAQILMWGRGKSVNDKRSESTALPRSGELVSPAIALVREAGRTARLPELRKLVTQKQRRGSESLGCRALLTLVEIEARNYPAAEEQMSSLIKLARSRGVYAGERGPEGVVMEVASQQPELLVISLELASLVWQQTLADPSRVSERWHRFVYATTNTLRAQSKLDMIAMMQLSLLDRPSANWIPESRMTAWSCGQGLPVARWLISDGAVHHLTGHDHDVLCYAIPLLDNYELEADLSTFNFREIQLLAGGFWAGPGSDRKACDNGSFFQVGERRWIDPPLTRMFDWMRVRVVVRNGFRTTFINGRPVVRMPHSVDSDPWAGIHSHWFGHGTVKNLRITADDDSVPKEVSLRIGSGLQAWIPYHDISKRASWKVVATHPAVAAEASADRTMLPQLVGPFQADVAGSDAENLLSYHRPMIEDGVISYEFFYRPGKTLVHPAIGRLALLLRPDGVREHWITDGRFDRTGLRPANESTHEKRQRNPQQLPLRAEQWNRIELQRRGNVVLVVLNGTMVYERSLDDVSARRFGLFHYADKTEARVRDIRWAGTWPQILPQTKDQQLADLSLEQTLGDTSTLAASFTHNFGDGVPLERFQITGDSWRQYFKQLADGVHLSRPGGGEYIKFAIAPRLQLEGDFDVTVAFCDFHCAVPDGLDGNAHLLVGFEADDFPECRIYRSFNRFHPDLGSEQVCTAGIFRDVHGKRQFEYPAVPPEESTAGRMRFVRRGAQLYYLFAEEDSPHFRLIHQEEVGADKTRPGWLKLVLETNREGLTEVVWNSLDIRAASITGAAVQ